VKWRRDIYHWSESKDLNFHPLNLTGYIGRNLVSSLQRKVFQNNVVSKVKFTFVWFCFYFSNILLFKQICSTQHIQYTHTHINTCTYVYIYIYNKRMHIWYNYLLHVTHNTPRRDKLRIGSKKKLDVCVQSNKLQHIDIQLLTTISENTTKYCCFIIVIYYIYYKIHVPS
jgi:hypothetical protein